ncbi:MAG: CRISPR-associated endonuclease Cas2 [bacterium]
MRVLVIFDLPTITLSDRREYTIFRKFLIKSGFIMMQESVYSKLALNMTAAEVVMNSVRKSSPSAGLVQMLVMTEKQFSRIELVVGEYVQHVVDNDDRLIIL